jgi:competence protein ComEC
LLVRAPLLRFSAPLAAGIAIAEVAGDLHGWIAAGLVAVTLAFVSMRLWPAAEFAAGLALGAAVLSLRLAAPAPVAGVDAVALRLLGAPERSGRSCRVQVWISGRPGGLALLHAGGSACELLPGQYASARLVLAPLRGVRNPGGRDRARNWARRGVRVDAFVVDGLIVPVEAPLTLAGRLELGRRRLARVFGSDAATAASVRRADAVLRALVAGQRDRVDSDTRQIFVRSGTAHLLAVSGLHVGWVFASVQFAVAWLLRAAPWPSWLRRSRAVALLLGISAAAAYAALTGLALPAFRAAAMAAAAAVATFHGRPAARWNALGLAALAVLVSDPAALFDASFALSFTAVAGIALWSPPSSLWRGPLHASVAASLATAPWVAWLGLPIPISALAANALAVPLFAGVVVPLGLAVAGAGVVHAPAGEALLPLARGIAAAGLGLLEWFDSRDLIQRISAPAWLAASVACAGFGARLCALGRRGPAAVAAGVALFLGLSLLAQGDSAAERGSSALFLDVGHGDAVLLHSGSSSWLVDAGPRSGSFDAGRHVVLPALRAEAVGRLEVLVVTHTDRDHIGGAAAVVDATPVGEIWLTVATAQHPDADALRRAAARRGVPLRIVARGDSARLGTLRVSVLWPRQGRSAVPSNDTSIVLRVAGAEGCLLLPGDISARVERSLIERLSACGVLKLAHHGSGSSSSDLWLDRLAPRIAIASAGRRRRGALPHPAVRAALRERAITLYETHRQGAVRVRLTNRGLVVQPRFP